MEGQRKHSLRLDREIKRPRPEEARKGLEIRPPLTLTPFVGIPLVKGYLGGVIRTEFVLRRDTFSCRSKRIVT